MNKHVTAWLKEQGFERIDNWMWRHNRKWACAYHMKRNRGYLITVAFYTGQVLIEVLKSKAKIRVSIKDI